MNPAKALFITSQALNTDKIPADCITTTTTIYDILLSRFLIAKWRNSGTDSAAEGTVLAISACQRSHLRAEKRKIKIKAVDNTVLLIGVLQEERSRRQSVLPEQFLKSE